MAESGPIISRRDLLRKGAAAVGVIAGAGGVATMLELGTRWWNTKDNGSSVDTLVPRLENSANKPVTVTGFAVFRDAQQGDQRPYVRGLDTFIGENGVPDAPNPPPQAADAAELTYTLYKDQQAAERAAADPKLRVDTLDVRAFQQLAEGQTLDDLSGNGPVTLAGMIRRRPDQVVAQTPGLAPYFLETQGRIK